MNTLKNQSGFTLIEVVIALGILGFGILTMFSMQVFGIRGNADANTITQEVVKSAEGIEHILSENYDDLTAGNCNTKAKVKLLPYYTVACTLQADVPIPGMMTVNVTIANTNNNKQVTLEYMKTKASI